MSKLKQSILKAIRELTLLDDAFMTKIFEDDIKQAQFLLRILFNDDTIKVKKVSTQKRIKNLQGRDLQLDILAEKADGTKFNVEVQNQNSGAIPQRARYHLSILDGKSLPKGKYFDKLPDNYVIFITKNDVLQGKLPIYHIHRTIDENGQPFADGSHIIYVNGEIQDETPLGRLMHDFCCKNPDDMHYKELAEKAKYFKEEQGGTEIMGDVIEKLMAEVKAEEMTKHAAKLAKLEAKLAKVKTQIAKAKTQVAEAKTQVAEAKTQVAEAKTQAAEAKTQAAEAEKKERTSLAKKMLANNESIEKVVLYSELPLAEVRALAKQLSA